MKLTPGIHHPLGMETYHAWALDKAKLIEGPMSCSMLKEFAVNPYAWLRSEPKPKSEAMKLGSVLDAALTEPYSLWQVVCDNYHPVFDCVAPYDDFKTKVAQLWRQEAINGGLEPVSRNAVKKAMAEFEARASDIIDNANKCADAVRSHDVAGAILEGAQFQVGAVCDVGGIPAKCLIDILPSRGEWEECLVDYKTTSNGLDDESIRKTISQYRYHWQAGFYRTVFNKASDDRLCEQFVLIFQDPSTREVRVVTLDDDSMLLGTRCVGQAVKEYVRAAHQGIHSRYAKTASTLGVMPYTAMNEDEWLINMEERA